VQFGGIGNRHTPWLLRQQSLGANYPRIMVTGVSAIGLLLDK
jgi:hypothetical protein